MISKPEEANSSGEEEVEPMRKLRSCKKLNSCNWSSFALGLEINLKEHRLGISERRASWMDGWFTRVLETKLVLVRDMRDALGRMSFV